MRTRNDLLDTLPKHSLGAELGVFEGTFSDEILRRVQPAMLFLVDLFAGMVASGDADGANVHNADMCGMYHALRARHAPRDVMVVRANSWVWLKDRPRHSLDWVYIDTDHTYQTTVAELSAALHAVRPGGVIAGHDYHEFAFPDLWLAVNEFCERNRLTPEIFAGDKLPSYRIQLL